MSLKKCHALFSCFIWYTISIFTVSSEPWKFSDIPIDDGGGGEIRKKKKEKKKKIDWQRQWHHKLYTEKKIW